MPVDISSVLLRNHFWFSVIDLSSASLIRKQNASPVNTTTGADSQLKYYYNSYEWHLPYLISATWKKKNIVSPPPTCNILHYYGLFTTAFISLSPFAPSMLPLYISSQYHALKGHLLAQQYSGLHICYVPAVSWDEAWDSQCCVCSHNRWQRVNIWQWYITLCKGTYSEVRLKMMFDHIIHSEYKRNFHKN
jgi:hypothetical protein